MPVDLSTPVRVAIRAAVRSSANRPVAAERAAEELRQGVLASVWAEIRWAFTPPRAWLVGVGVNLLLALVWLLVQPVRHEGNHDWVVLVGAYFSSFILADVTTTNMLGVDNVRVEKALAEATPPWRLLMVKNLALLAIVGLPTLTLAVALTLWLETPDRLVVTIPDVAVPLLSWLAVGNLVSVALPIGYEPLIHRWRQRRQLRRTALWLVHLVLPYALLYLADPVYGLPQMIFWHRVPLALGPTLGPDAGRSLVHIGVALLLWGLGTALAVVFVRVRGLRIR
jgi:hypothetical protein